jgi:hypothetical protein
MMENLSRVDSLAVVVTGADGKIKNTRFTKTILGLSVEFKPKKLYISLINSGRIVPNTWKIPFLFGSWSVYKGHNNGNS